MRLSLKAIAYRVTLSKFIPYGLCTRNLSKEHYQNNCVSNVHKIRNSIQPTFEDGFAYGYYFPKEWSCQKIQKTLDPTLKQIEKVSIVSTSIGQNSGKILIKFKDDKTRQKYLQKYNEDFLLTQDQSQKIVLLPFNLKTNQKKQEFKINKIFKYPVRISNMDFDINENQIRKLCADYGEISHIDMNLRYSGINRGFVTVFWKNYGDAAKFVSFLDGLLYRDRKLKAQLVAKKIEKKEIQFLEVPTFTFKANEELMKKMKSKQYETD